MSKEINEFKFDVISSFGRSLNSDQPSPLIIQTSTGTINGHLLNDDDLPEVYDEEGKFIGNEEDQHLYYSVVNSLLNIRRDNSNFTEENKNFFKGLWLKNVKIFLPSQSLPLEAPYYYLFLDQVVGVTYGSLDTNNQELN